MKGLLGVASGREGSVARREIDLPERSDVPPLGGQSTRQDVSMSELDIPLPPPRRRSRRLRKKLRIEEFRELGFAVGFHFDDTVPPAAASAAWDAFIGKVEARGLAFGGSESAGFVTKTGPGSANEDDRRAVREALAALPGVAGVAIGELEDAWYAPSETRWATLDAAP